MRRPRVRLLFLFTIVIIGGLVVRGQSGARLVILNVGLPAVNEDTIPDDTHRPRSPEAIRRAGIRAIGDLVRVGTSGRAFTAGRVIVKFRDEVSESTRASAVRSVVASGVRQPRDAAADFDVVAIDPRENAETI